MNEVLKRYVLGDGIVNELWDEDTPMVERKVYKSEEAKGLGYSQVLETLRSSPFLNLAMIGERLNIWANEDEEADMNLMELLEYHEINYEPIIRKRIVLVGYSRMKIVELLTRVTRPKSTLLVDIYSQWLENTEFKKAWNVLEPLLGEFAYLLDFYGIRCIEFNGEYPRSLDELIKVELGDDVEDRVLRFEKFNDE